MATFSWRTWLGFLFFGMFFYGLYTFLTDIEENRCEMTYMYENPEYIKQQLPEILSNKFPNYNLYLYGEGRYAEDLKKQRFTGVPVLFIPGSAGSHRQVRSLASVALRTAYSRQSPFHFNFFTIDFNRELGALYGGVLWDQTLFLKECIQHIHSLYEQKGLNRSVILFGHSMGGVIPRALFLLPNFNVDHVSCIIMLAAPHQPVLSADSHLSNYYAEIDNFWNDSNKIADVPPIISIGGGERDILVRSDTTILKGEIPSLHLSVMTTSVPGVWLSTDHLCILWCKQLVVALSRSLFDLVDKSTLKLTTDKSLVKAILNFYLVERARGQRYVPKTYMIPAVFSQTGEWILKEETSWRFTRNKIIQAVYILIPLYDWEIIAIHALGIDQLNWVFACNVSSHTKICVEGENLSNRTEVTPTFSTEKLENRFFRMASKDLKAKGHSHLLVHIALSEKVNIYGERYKPQSRHKIVILPSLLRSIFSYSPLRMLTSTLTEGAVYHNISLKGLTDVWQFYSLTMETRICKYGVKGDGFVRFYVPWSKEDRYYPIKSSLNSVTIVKASLYQARPPDFKSNPQLHIVLNPECSYVMLVRAPLGQLTARFLQFFQYSILNYVSALLLGALSAQLYHLTQYGTIPCLLTSRQLFPGFAMLVIIPELIGYGIRNVHFVAPFIPVPDDISLYEQQHHFLLLRPAAYVFSYGILVTLSIVSQAFVVLSGRCVIWVCKGDKTLMLPSTKATTSANLLTFLLCCFLTLVGVCLCGALAMIATLLIQLFKLISMCGYNRLEEDRRGPTPSSTRWHFHHGLFLLQLVATSIMMPSFVVWAQNVLDHPHLVNDPHLVPAIVTIMAHASLWQPAMPTKSRYRYKTIVAILGSLSVLTAMYSLTTTWRITHFIATAFAFVAAHQVAVKGRENPKID